MPFFVYFIYFAQSQRYINNYASKIHNQDRIPNIIAYQIGMLNNSKNLCACDDWF